MFSNATTLSTPFYHGEQMQPVIIKTKLHKKRNYQESGFEKVYPLPFGIIAKLVKENEKPLLHGDFFIYQGIFYFVITPYLLEHV